MNNVSPDLIKPIFQISLTLLITVILNFILRSFVKVPKSLDNRRGRTYAYIVRNIISVVIYAISLHIILKILSVDITPLLASAGIIGLSIGLGAKPLIEDLIAGLMLLSQDSIAIGDRVEIDGSIGDIEKISFRTLTIRAKDGSLHIIPNGTVKKVINHSRSEDPKNQTKPTQK